MSLTKNYSSQAAECGVLFQKESALQNQPMSSNDQGKLVIFSVLMAPSIIFLFGVIPVFFLAFGIYMMKKNQDFSSIDTAVKNFKGYTWLALVGCTLSVFYHWYDLFNGINSRYMYNNWYDSEGLVISLVFTTIALGYLVAVQVLFYGPLKRHSEWVSVNGIFSKEPKSNKFAGVPSELDIIKGEKLKQYSVADELTKWAKLKEDGHISEGEFNEVRAKLLKRK